MSETLDSPGLRDAGSPEWLWDWTRYPRSMPEQSKDFDVAISECWKYGEDEGARTVAAIKRYEIRSFHTDSMDSWLKEPIPIRNGQRPSSGFKVVVMPCDKTSSIPHLTKEQTLAFNAALGLPDFQLHNVSVNTGACGMFLQSDSSYVFIHRKTSDTASISSAFRYDPQTNVTQGIFYIKSEKFLLNLFEKMPEQFIKCNHPLLLPLLAIELTVESKTSRLLDHSNSLEKIEIQTGHGLTEGQGKSNSPGDYRALVRKLGQVQSQLFLELATTSACQFSTQIIRQKLQYLDRMLPEECQKKLNLPSQILNERIEYLLSTIEHAKVWEGLKERMESQQTVLFNLIAQSDNLVNISLAKDSREMAVASKQDSSAMKIIALLTTFFLPGTFVASFFAMPLFNWSEPSLSHVAGGHFWIYWAVTGPLTLITMAGVIVWALWNNRRVQLLQSRARESVDTKSPGDRGQDTDDEQSTESESDEGETTNEDQSPENELEKVGNLKKYSLLGILSRRRRRSGSATVEP